MNWKVKANELKNSFGTIQSICNKKTVSEITAMALMNFEKQTLIISATDFESYIQITIPCSIDRSNINDQINYSESINKFALNAKRVYEIIRDLDENEEIQISREEKTVKINTNTIDISLAICCNNLETFNPSNNYNNHINATIENFASMKSITFSNALGYCMYLATSNIISQNQGGSLQLFFGKAGEFKMSSTDGHSLAHIHIQSETIKPKEDLIFIISKKAATDIKKIIENYEKNTDIIIGILGKSLTISGENFTNITKTLSDPFPAHEKILKNKEEYIFEFNKEDIQKCMRRISCLTAGKFIPALFEFENNNLTIEINHSEVGSAKEKLEIKYNNKNLNKEVKKIFFNAFPPYVLQAINSIPENKDGRITISCSNSKKPIFFKHENEASRMLYVVMPMINQKEI